MKFMNVIHYDIDHFDIFKIGVKFRTSSYQFNSSSRFEQKKDLSNLMSHAKEMAVLARATSARLEQKSKDGSNMDEVARLRGIMLDLGVDTNVGNSKNNLESEIGVVSRSLLPKGGGMALLEEVFCALNRARGTELVSPDEIYHAAKHIETTLPSAGLKFKKYKSGICVLIDNSLTESAIIDKVEANY